jgi:hypothetical protein
LIHLNDYEAFKKVLPSKIFELAAYDKPVIAGVGGYAARFIEDDVSNTILVNPCDVDACITKLKNYQYKTEQRTAFVKNHSRKKINQEMATSIAGYF